MLLQNLRMIEEDRFDTGETPIGFRFHFGHLGHERRLGWRQSSEVLLKSGQRLHLLHADLHLLHVRLGLRRRGQRVFQPPVSRLARPCHAIYLWQSNCIPRCRETLPATPRRRPRRSPR